MRFKCGLTDEEKKAKREVELHKAKCIIEHGEVVFAWWPITLSPGKCLWLEKVHRWPTHYMDGWGDWGRLDSTSKYSSRTAIELVADAKLKYRYESLDKEVQEGV